MKTALRGKPGLLQRAQANYAPFSVSQQVTFRGDSSTSQYPVPPSLSSKGGDGYNATSSNFNFDCLCQDEEGWGPLSKYRDLDFTPCFEDVALFLVPALLLIFFAILDIRRLSQAPIRRLTKVSRLILFVKDGLVVTLFLCATVEVSTIFNSNKSPVRSIQFWTSTASLFIYAANLLLQHLNHTRTRRSSTTLLLFWLFHALSCLVRFRTMDATLPSTDQQANAMVRLLQVARLSLVVSVFALECVGIEVGGLHGSHYHQVDTNHGRTGANDDGCEDSIHAAPAIHPIDSTVYKECPEVTANIFSLLTFHWFQPMMTLGAKSFLTEGDMWNLSPGESAEVLGEQFDHHYSTCRTKEGESCFWWTLVYAYGGPFLTAAMFKAAQDALAFMQPQVLRLLLQFVESRQGSDPQTSFRGYLLSSLLFVVAIIQTICMHAYFQRSFTTGMRLKAGLISAIFKKSLRLSDDDRARRATGDIVNLMSVDVSRLQDLCTYGHTVWSALLQMILAFVSLYNLLGWPSFVGVAIMVVSIPINILLARYTKNLAERTMKVKDKRSRLMNEILVNIKSIKLFAWEQTFSAKVHQLRSNEELALLKKSGTVNAIFNFYWTVVPFTVSLSTFVCYSATTEKPLTADVIFPALAMYQLLSSPLIALASIVAAIMQSLVSAQRLSSFLDAGELDPQARTVVDSASAQDCIPMGAKVDEEEEGQDVAIAVREADFMWSQSQSEPTLSIPDLTVPKGELWAVLGKVGGGKSSLLSAMLGEMHRSCGQCIIRGKTAYFAQGGWCMGGTIRDNILFGLGYEQECYEKVLEVCALSTDLAVLPEGDLTEIGEKGVSLSGGQRARVALARACYARADISLLDDPLAAVDSHVGAHIFENVIGPQGLLRNKTRILTTNTTSFLSEAHQVVMLQRGKLSPEQGTYEDVVNFRRDIFNLIQSTGMENQRGSEVKTREDDVAEELSESIDGESDQSGHQPDPFKVAKTDLRTSKAASTHRPPTAANAQVKGKSSQQVRTSQQAEKSQRGSVSWDVYRQYLLGASAAGVSLYLFAVITSQILQVSRDIVLKEWGTHNSGGSHVSSMSEDRYYLTLYGVVGFTASIAACVAPFIFYTWLSISRAKQLHEDLFNNIIFAPLMWFETIPTGRLLNLFSRDINVIDELLPRDVYNFARAVVGMAGVLVVISASIPSFLVVILPLWLIYRMILRYYLATSRELRRLDALSKSPLVAWFQESLSGLSTIRALSQTSRFKATIEARVDLNLMCYYPSMICNRWLAIRVESVGALVILIASTLAVRLSLEGGSSSIRAGLLGLMMSQALSTTQLLNVIVRAASEVEQNIISVERVLDYSDTEPETPHNTVRIEPPKGWPAQGKIEFRNYSTRYRKGLGPVLQNINLTIQDGERVAVVGRTGAGKSSLALALFRILEPDQGTILIDDYDVCKLKLKGLRSSIAIIPQDPQLWEGTLRDNIDPSGTHTDEELWSSLAQARLKDHIIFLPGGGGRGSGGLDIPLTEGASNLSSGQRQLVCVARALLRGSKILVLDEATSNVDLQSDSLLQDMIRNELGGKTLITIAHRLSTIIGYDRVAVLEQGKLVEFDSPLNLYDCGKVGKQRQQDDVEVSSFFFSMCEKAGISRDDIVQAGGDNVTPHA